MAKKQSLGKIMHYFDKIMVAALVLKSPLSVGDAVKISGHKKEFTQKISSMQMDHKSVTKAKKGDDVAFQVDQAVKEGDGVEKI